MRPGENPNVCRHCGKPIDLAKALVQNLYRIEAVETTLAQRITVQDEERERRGFDIQTTYSFPAGGTAPTAFSIRVHGRELAKFTYCPAAGIWRINRGWKHRSDPAQTGFMIDPVSGIWSKSDEKEPNPRNQRIVPYVNDHRNVLVLSLPAEFAVDSPPIRTLSAALQRSIESVFQLDSSEIAVEYLPNPAKPTSLLIYEAAEGGTGVLGRLVRDHGRALILRRLARSALEIMHIDYDEVDDSLKERPDACETGCYKCLLSYYNQTDHEFIDRRLPVVREWLFDLLHVEEADFTAIHATPPPPEGLAADIAARGLRLPSDSNKNLPGGLVADAWYASERVAVVVGEPSDKWRDFADDQGVRVLFCPEDLAARESFFNDNSDFFKTNA